MTKIGFSIGLDDLNTDDSDIRDRIEKDLECYSNTIYTNMYYVVERSRHIVEWAIKHKTNLYISQSSSLMLHDGPLTLTYKICEEGTDKEIKIGFIFRKYIID